MEKRDSFLVYRSFIEAANTLPKSRRWDALEAIADYAMDGIEPDMNKLGVAGSVFLVAKPLVEKNNQRYENGKKGGRPKKDGEKNQSETKPKPNHNQTITKPKPNVNVNDNVNGLDPLTGSKPFNADREAPDGGAPAPAELVTADESEKLLEELKNKRLIEQAALAAVKGARG